MLVQTVMCLVLSSLAVMLSTKRNAERG